MKNTATQFAEYVSPGHPDRLADAVAERLVEFAQSQAPTACRNLVGVEVAIHDSTVFIDGRIALEGEATVIETIPLPRVPFDTIVRGVFAEAGYNPQWGPDPHWGPDPQSLEILVRVCEEELSLQEADIRPYSDDQNVVIGYACECTVTNHLPPAHYLALTLGRRMNDMLRKDPEFAVKFGPDFKILCTCRTSQGRSGVRFEWERLTFSVQHCRGVGLEEQHRILAPIIRGLLKTLEEEGLDNVARGFEPRRHLVLNGAGDIVIGGPRGDKFHGSIPLKFSCGIPQLVLGTRAAEETLLDRFDLRVASLHGLPPSLQGRDPAADPMPLEREPVRALDPLERPRYGPRPEARGLQCGRLGEVRFGLVDSPHAPGRKPAEIEGSRITTARGDRFGQILVGPLVVTTKI